MVEQPAGESSPDAIGASTGSNTILDFLILMARNWKPVVCFPSAVALLTSVVVLLVPRWYTATAKIMPPQQSQSNAVAILGQLGVLSGGASQALGLKNPSDVYVAILKSRTISDNLIKRFDLRKIYDEDYLFEVRKELLRNSNISSGREGIITIEVDDKDPTRASEIANAYVEELRGLTVNLAVSEAGQRRLFFEGQLKKAKNDLSNAELELKKFTLEAGLVNPQGQIGLSVAAAAALRAQISAKEIQIAAMRSFATTENPDMKRSQQEITALRGELAKMEKDTDSSKGDVMVPFGKAPEVAMEYVRRFRDMKYFETLFEVLAKQYEIARIDEAKDATLIQVLDVALPPEKGSKPQRALIVVVAVLIAVVLVVTWVQIMDKTRKARRDPMFDQKLDVLRSLFGRR